MTTRIRLTEAQVSALECRGIREPGLDDSPRTAAAWTGGAGLEVPAGYQEALELMDELIEHSNGEDAQAEMTAGTETGVLAGRAARSLAAIATKVCKVIVAEHPE